MNAGKLTAHQSDLREIPLGPIEIESLRSSLSRSSLNSSDAQQSADRSTNAAAPKSSIVRSFKTRSLRLKGASGENLRLEFVDHPLGGGRPPLAVEIYKDERPVAMNEYSYERDGRGWRAVRSRSSVFDVNGKVSLIADQDLSRVRRGRATVSLGSARWLREEAGSAAAQLAQLVQPDALYAAIPLDDGSGGCFREILNLAAATLAETGAAAALYAAYASCPASPVTCVPLVLSAQAALAAADIYLGIAIADLYACQHQSPAPAPAPSPGTPGGGGGGFVGCDTYIVEISYDGGASWYYLETIYAC